MRRRRRWPCLRKAYRTTLASKDDFTYSTQGKMTLEPADGGLSGAVEVAFIHIEVPRTRHDAQGLGLKPRAASTDRRVASGTAPGARA